MRTSKRFEKNIYLNPKNANYFLLNGFVHGGYNVIKFISFVVQLYCLEIIILIRELKKKWSCVKCIITKMIMLSFKRTTQKLKTNNGENFIISASRMINQFNKKEARRKKNNVHIHVYIFFTVQLSGNFISMFPWSLSNFLLSVNICKKYLNSLFLCSVVRIVSSEPEAICF